MANKEFVTIWIENEYDYNEILALVDEYSADNPKVHYPRCYQNGDMEHYWGSVVGYESDILAFVKRYQCEHVIRECFADWLNVIVGVANFNSALDQLKHDSVSHPSHYSFGKHEPIDVIADWGLNFNLGNTVKYISRAGRKDPTKTLEDLKKARFYLDYEIEHFGEQE